MNRRIPNVLMGLAVGILISQSEPLVAKEARPPKWPRDVLDAFFDDARDTLAGPRPDYEASPELQDSAWASSPPGANDNWGRTWSKLITLDTIESEVKRLSQSVAGTVARAGDFKGGAYKDARRDFSELAVLFAVTAQYPGDARWKEVAGGLSNEFSYAASKLKVGTDATYREAAARKQDLVELVRGGRPHVPAADASVADWSQVSGREPLMQRINIAHEERLTKWLADANTFRRKQGDVQHEAQIVALLADVIHREAFEYWDDETFTGYAIDLQQAASDVSTAASADDYDKAREAIGRATNACADCHAGYRG